MNYRITRKVQGKKKRLLVHHDRIKPYRQRPAHLIAEQDEQTVVQVEETEPTQPQPQETVNGPLHTDSRFALNMPHDEEDDSESEDELDSEADDHEEEVIDNEGQAEIDQQVEEATPRATRSGRLIRTPAHLKDYIC